MTDIINRFIIRWILIPLRLKKTISSFITRGRKVLLQQIVHLEDQFLDFEIRKKKMTAIENLLRDLIIPSTCTIRYKGCYYYQIYFLWLKYRFQRRVFENGLSNFGQLLEILDIKIQDQKIQEQKLPLLLQVFSCIRCNKEATYAKEFQINPIRPALQGIQGHLHGLCIRYQQYSIFGLVNPDPLYHYRRQIVPELDAAVEGHELLPTISLRDLLILEPLQLNTMLKRDKNKVKIYQTQSLDTLSTEFKFLPLGMKHRMITLMIYGKLSSICRMFLGQIPEANSEALIKNLDWNQRLSLGRPLLNVKIETPQNKEVPYEMKISCMSAPEKVKAKAFDMLKMIRKSNDGAPKAQAFLDSLLRIPFGQIRQEPALKDHKKEILQKIKDEHPTIDTQRKSVHVVLDELNNAQALSYRKELASAKEKQQSYLNGVHKTLESAVHGHDEAKQQVQRLLAQWICGGQSGMVIGLQGPPGNGKTTLIREGLAKCLVDQKGQPRPVGFISLGGSACGSSLEGHSYTYQGSKCGRIAEVLMNANCMNPILLFDELDKVSKTERGREIIGILTHLTDSTQNKEFNDRYFDGIPLDLSRALMVFTFNDISAIDPILLDRLTVIKTKPLSLPDKLTIARHHLLPEIAASVGLTQDDIQISNPAIKKIIQQYTAEAGARQLKQLLQDLFRELNLRRLMDPSIQMSITDELIEEVFKNRDKTRSHSISEMDLVGQINGMYANAIGMGGVMPIQVSKTRSENALSMELTGMQGDVMKESMKCAKTMAWSLLDEDMRAKINSRETFGLHIHCPAAATPKDGPSAGGAICLAVMSSLTDRPIRRDVSMTGELDLQGNITAIGGLHPKLVGAKEAGIKLALIPKENHEQLMRLREQNLSPEDDNFTVMEIGTIDEAIDVVFCCSF